MGHLGRYEMHMMMIREHKGTYLGLASFEIRLPLCTGYINSHICLTSDIMKKMVKRQRLEILKERSGQ